MTPALQHTVDELTALIRAVALDPGLEVVLGEPGSGWAITPALARVRVDEADLLRQHPDDLRGLACHEAAHAAVTRYHDLVPTDLLQKPALHALLNALEDCRIEAWLVRRLPGAAPWVQRYNDRLFPEDAAGLGQAPWFHQFCIGAIHQWWHGTAPPGLAPEVVEALAATADARRRAVEALPPVDADVPLADALAYAAHPVAEVYAHRDRFAPPDAFEKLVRLSAFHAWSIVWREVRPVYDALRRADEAHGRATKEAEARLLQLLRALRMEGPPRGAPRSRRVRLTPELADLLRAQGLPALEPGGEPYHGELSPELRAAAERVIAEEAGDAWEAARRAVAHLTDPLFAELERLLRPTTYPRWVSGFPTGSRVDLRAAMQLGVAPDAHARLWQRKTLPTKRDPAFTLLLDLSGSMAGAEIEEGFKGLVLLCEVLARLGVPFAAHGFQDRVVRFKAFDEPFDPSMRVRLGAMPLEVMGRRPGGRNRPQDNWDGPVLLEAAAELLEWPARDRVLVVVSDGLPSGPADAESALRRAIAQVGRDVHLVGVGLGEGASHVANFYPDAVARIPLDRFPSAMARLLSRLLHVPGAGRPGASSATARLGGRG